MNEQGVLQVSKVACQRDERVLFRDLSFLLKAGQMLQIQGANGTGKSTLLRAIAGLRDVDEGEINCSQDLAYLGHKLGLSDQLTVKENLLFSSLTPDKSRFDETLAQLGLSKHQDSLVKKLSAGQRQRLALARIVLSQSTLWLLDEPMTALDSDGKQVLTAYLQTHLSQNGAVVLTSHQVMDLGRVDYQVMTL